MSNTVLLLASIIISLMDTGWVAAYGGNGGAILNIAVMFIIAAATTIGFKAAIAQMGKPLCQEPAVSGVKAVPPDMACNFSRCVP